MSAAARVDVVAILAAVLLPPLGVYLVRGLGPSFWICLLLTVIGIVPGMVFALVTVLRPDLIRLG